MKNRENTKRAYEQIITNVNKLRIDDMFQIPLISER